MNIQELLQPNIINSISGLELIAKTVSEGHLHGLHKSSMLSTGGEFSQYRSYEPGDDLRLIDWKLYGRSERYYTKLAEEETNVKIKFVLDASNSMAHEQDGVSKLDFAKIIIASLGYLAFYQGDAIGLFAVNNQKVYNYPAQVQKLYSNFLYQLLEVNPVGKWPDSMDVSGALHGAGSKGMVVFISDMYQKEGEILKAVKRLKTNLNEVIFLQILTRDELEFNYKGVLAFEDLETGKIIKVDSSEAKKGYLNAIENHMVTVKDALLDAGILWEKFVVGDNLSEALSTFVKSRKQLL